MASSGLRHSHSLMHTCSSTHAPHTHSHPRTWVTNLIKIRAVPPAHLTPTHSPTLICTPRTIPAVMHVPTAHSHTPSPTLTHDCLVLTLILTTQLLLTNILPFTALPRPTGLGYDELSWRPPSVAPIRCIFSFTFAFYCYYSHPPASHAHTLASSHHWHASLIKRKAIPPAPAKSHGRHQQCKSKHKFKNMGDKLDKEKGWYLYAPPPTYSLPVALIRMNVKVTHWQQHENFCAGAGAVWVQVQ
ncbi:hypothetical protein M405DRAFT_866105 [Rhizopogon salebrosus TDB-379]|nr:hypothetical protein M405DRAFT_866105 [Rhizopogon salebrosus TDB-379]